MYSDKEERELLTHANSGDVASLKRVRELVAPIAAKQAEKFKVRWNPEASVEELAAYGTTALHDALKNFFANPENTQQPAGFFGQYFAWWARQRMATFSNMHQGNEKRENDC